MRDGGRIAAAIGVLDDIEARHRPVKLALKGWGLEARYAGAKDRAFVSGLVMDVLRRRRSLTWGLTEFNQRGRVYAALRFVWDWPVERIVAAAEDSHGPSYPANSDFDHWERGLKLDAAPSAVRGDYPDWLDPHMARVFGEGRGDEGAALAARAPVDLRVNTLKTDMARALKALAPFDPQPVDLVANAIRIAAPAASDRAPAVETAPEFERGWFEVQDLGSQWAAAHAGDVAGAQVLDFCAGGGGKTLALAAAMNNTGQIYAYDSNARRLTDTMRRSQRAGVRNLQIRSPIHADALAGLEGRMDVVFVDAPCSGSGAWRRHPDTKWRLTPDQLARRMDEQDAVLAAAAAFVKPEGRLIYVTCSLFAEENEDRVGAFTSQSTTFSATSSARLTPLRDQTDGFFATVLQRGR